MSYLIVTPKKNVNNSSKTKKNQENILSLFGILPLLDDGTMSTFFLKKTVRLVGHNRMRGHLKPYIPTTFACMHGGRSGPLRASWGCSHLPPYHELWSHVDRSNSEIKPEVWTWFSSSLTHSPSPTSKALDHSIIGVSETTQHALKLALRAHVPYVYVLRSITQNASTRGTHRDSLNPRSSRA